MPLTFPHGFINDDWQKAGLPPNYSSQLIDLYSNTNIGAGNVSYDLFTVPTGEIWTVQALGYRYIGSSPSNMITRVVYGGTEVFIALTQSPTSGVTYFVPNVFSVFPGAVINTFLNGSTAGDDIYYHLLGFITSSNE